MKLLIMQFSPTSRHSISLRSRYSPLHPALKHPQSVSNLILQFALCESQVILLHAYRRKLYYFEFRLKNNWILTKYLYDIFRYNTSNDCNPRLYTRLVSCLSQRRRVIIILWRTSFRFYEPVQRGGNTEYSLQIVVLHV
jgi:hypothetical protein